MMSAFESIINSIKQLTPNEQEKLIKLLEQKQNEKKQNEILNRIENYSFKSSILSHFSHMTNQEDYEKRIKRIEDQEKISREGIRHEDELISKRLTWMTTVQGFLFSAVGISLANGIPSVFIVILALMGITISISTRFTIYRSHTAIELYIRRWQRLQLDLLIGNIEEETWEKIKITKDDFINKHHGKINPNAIIIGYSVGYVNYDNQNQTNNNQNQTNKTRFWGDVKKIICFLPRIILIFLDFPPTDHINPKCTNINEDFGVKKNRLLSFPSENSENQSQQPNSPENSENQLQQPNSPESEELLKNIHLVNAPKRTLLDQVICWLSPPTSLPIIFVAAWISIIHNYKAFNPDTQKDEKSKIEFSSPLDVKINSPLDVKVNSPLDVKVIPTPSVTQSPKSSGVSPQNSPQQ